MKNRKDKPNKQTSLILLVLWPVLASYVSFSMNANFFVSTILFLAIPSVYLSFQKRDKIKKLLLFAVLFGIPISVVLDYIMETTLGWYVPHSIFGDYRLFDLITVDLVLWGIFEAYLILIFYEVFLEKGCKTKLYYPRFKYLLFFLYLGFTIFILFFLFNPDILIIDHFYFKMGIVLAVLPPILLLFKFPRFWNKLLNIGVYFLFFNFIYEFTAVRLGQWSFPAEHQLVGIVDFAGARFAFEELLFWMMFTAASVVSFYEFFDDDEK